jgi:hypothetical protein
VNYSYCLLKKYSWYATPGEVSINFIIYTFFKIIPHVDNANLDKVETPFFKFMEYFKFQTLLGSFVYGTGMTKNVVLHW